MRNICNAQHSQAKLESEVRKR